MTVVKEYHEDLDVDALGNWLRGCKQFFLQNFEDNGNCIKQGLHSLDGDVIFDIKNKLEKYIDKVYVRGVKE